MPKHVKAISSEEFHAICVGALVAGVANFALNASGLASISTRFLGIGDAYQLFRFKSLLFRLHCANVSANQAVGFVPGIPDTYPSTVAQVMELRSSLYQDQTQTVPSEWKKVPVADLHSQFPWYRCIDGTAPASQEFPGSLLVRGTGTDNYAVELKLVIEFKEPIATANTPAQVALLRSNHEDRARAVAARERERLLSLLAPATPGGK